MKRGEIYFADLDPVVGSEQGGVRPVLIIQNDLGNRFSPTVIVLPLTANFNKAPLRTHVPVRPPLGGLKKPSLVLCEQVRTLEKKRLRTRLGILPPQTLALVSRAFALAVGGGEEEGRPPLGKAEPAPLPPIQPEAALEEPLCVKSEEDFREGPQE